jgi:hypothetical protein
MDQEALMAERQSSRDKFEPNGGGPNRLDFDHHREERHKSAGAAGWDPARSSSADRSPGEVDHGWRDHHQRVPGPFAGLGPRGYQRSDDRICEELHDRLTAHGFIDATDITCAVQDGEVTLDGFVHSRQTKRAAEDVADGIQGVLDVHNNLRIQPLEDAGPMNRKPSRTRST